MNNVIITALNDIYEKNFGKLFVFLHKQMKSAHHMQKVWFDRRCVFLL